VALLVADVLREADPGWRVETETDPAEARRRLQEEAFDCVVTDLVMPGLDGLSLAEEVRGEREGVAFIAVTGRGSIEASVKALRLGFADFFEKPFDTEQIQRAVCRAVRQQREQQRLTDRFAELAQSNAKLEACQAQLNQKLEIAGHDLVRSNKRLARQMEDLARTADVARSLSGITELEDLLGLCAELLGDAVACDSATVALYEVQESAVGLMVRAYPESDDAPALCWLRQPIRGGLMCRAAQTNRTLHVERLDDSVLVDEQEKEFWHDGRLLAVPVPYSGRAVGTAVIHRTTGAGDFDAEDVKRLSSLAGVMGPAIAAAKIHHRQRCEMYATLESIAEANEARVGYLARHSARVLDYARRIGEGLGLSQCETGALQIAARLHDIGRLVIPDEATNHGGPLTEAQWEIVRHHAEVGEEFLKPLEFFGEVGEIIRGHHESYDGTGYPDAKAGEEIPLVARVLAVADAFDAMTSPRPYRQALSVGEAREQVQRLAGQQFDPRVVEVFLQFPAEQLEAIRSNDA
jgi:response regulator RpfG family c-di-GMP phosphodiesterase